MTINRNNLKILRDFLVDNYDLVSKKFDMADYTDIEMSDEDGLQVFASPGEVVEIAEKGNDPYAAECGSQFCMVGWCPAIPEFQKIVRQGSASSRNFGRLSTELFGISHWGNLWDYLFGCEWADSEKNSLEDAINRLNTVIDVTDMDELEWIADKALKELNGDMED